MTSSFIFHLHNCPLHHFTQLILLRSAEVHIYALLRREDFKVHIYTALANIKHLGLDRFPKFHIGISSQRTLNQF